METDLERNLCRSLIPLRFNADVVRRPEAENLVEI
jgi:hypothetical protein